MFVVCPNKAQLGQGPLLPPSLDDVCGSSGDTATQHVARARARTVDDDAIYRRVRVSVQQVTSLSTPTSPASIGLGACGIIYALPPPAQIITSSSRHAYRISWSEYT